VPRHDYWIGVPSPGRWTELLNSDAALYGGSGMGNLGGVEAVRESAHGRPYTLRITLPPLAAVCFVSGDA
jgi:1,4-alpha-glucan branching enzyme